MEKLRSGVAVALSVAAAGALAACSKTQAAIPDDFCRVPVSKAALSPLIPDGGNVREDYTTTESRPGAACNLRVDGRLVLSVNLLRWDRTAEPTDWNKVASPYKFAAEHKVSFPGHAAIGSDHAVVEAKCNARTAYMSFVVDLSGDQVENTSSGYKKLQGFINDFVPRETEKFSCTK